MRVEVEVMADETEDCGLGRRDEDAAEGAEGLGAGRELDGAAGRWASRLETKVE